MCSPRPSLAPLDAFSSSGPRDAVCPVPAFVAFLFWFCPCDRRDTAFVQRRPERKTEDQVLMRRRRIRGLGSEDRSLPIASGGEPDTWSSPWFTEEMKPEEFTWCSHTDCKASRVIGRLVGGAGGSRRCVPPSLRPRRMFGHVFPSHTEWRTPEQVNEQKICRNLTHHLQVYSSFSLCLGHVPVVSLSRSARLS